MVRMEEEEKQRWSRQGPILPVSPPCLHPSSIPGGMSSGSPLPRFPVPLSAMAQSLRKERAEAGAGWVASGTDGVLFFLGLLLS